MTKSVYDVTLLDLLPESMKHDPSVVALAKAITPEFQLISEEIDRNILLANIDTQPEPVVDLLAWEMHVDFYDPTLSLQQKRELVKSSPEWHRYKGTRWAVEKVTSILYPNSTVEEWFEYGGQPFYFKIILNLDAFFSSSLDTSQLIELINTTKNRRSWLQSIMLVTTNQRQVCHNIIRRVKINIKNNLWAPIGGDKEKSPFLDGSSRLDGSGFLNGRPGSDGPYHNININRRFVVRHMFGSFIEREGRFLDGGGFLDGSRRLAGDVREFIVPIKHSVSPAIKIASALSIQANHSAAMKARVQVRTGVRLLDGQGQLGGSGTLSTQFCNQAAKLRLKKKGITVEEVAI